MALDCDNSGGVRNAKRKRTYDSGLLMRGVTTGYEKGEQNALLSNEASVELDHSKDQHHFETDGVKFPKKPKINNEQAITHSLPGSNGGSSGLTEASEVKGGPLLESGLNVEKKMPFNCDEQKTGGVTKGKRKRSDYIGFQVSFVTAGLEKGEKNAVLLNGVKKEACGTYIEASVEIDQFEQLVGANGGSSRIMEASEVKGGPNKDHDVEKNDKVDGIVNVIPAPFSVAINRIRDRTSKCPRWTKKTVRLNWSPKEKRPVRRLAPSLQDLSMKILAENADAITSLEGVPYVLRHKLTQLLCDSRKLNYNFFRLLTSGTPAEISIQDCSWLGEEEFTKTFAEIDASYLKVLQLNQCARFMSDYVMFTTLATRELSSLLNVSLRGARISDAGLKALLDCTPALKSINLGCCPLLTSAGISILVDKRGQFLKELYLDTCFQIEAHQILHALLKLELLEVLSMSHFESVDDSFIIELVGQRGKQMKELVLADCMKLTDKALRAIAESCPGLRAIDLANLYNLTDESLENLANGCHCIEKLRFCRNKFSDQVVAAYIEVCGAPLKELSLNHVDKVADDTAMSLAQHGTNLHTLDLSWCRKMTDASLGLIADSCLTLSILKLFGCSQITDRFVNGHSNEGLTLIGLANCQIIRNLQRDEVLRLQYSS